MEDQTPPQQDNTNYDKNWIIEVARQSWEPELIISGVAIYLSAQLPEVLREWFAYYSFNYADNSDNVMRMLTRLIYGVFTSSSYLLIIAFIIHFATRAFWVGLVGLFSVYPKGIQFEKLPRVSEYYREILKSKMSSLDEFIIRLDKFASIIFSLCFVFVLLTIGLGFIYAVFLIAIFIIKLSLSEAAFRESQYYIFITLLAAFFLLSVVVGLLNHKRWRNKPSIMKWQYRLTNLTTSIMFPFIYPLIRYIAFTFQSNVSKKRVNAVSLVIFIFFYILLFFSMLGNKAGILVESRNFYSKGSSGNKINPDYYDNLRDKSVINPSISIQSDVVQEDYLKVFVAYDKDLDNDLIKFCKTIKVADTLKKEEKRRLKDKHRLECFARYFQVYVGDSLYSNLDYVFWVDYDEGKKGLLTYLPTAGFRQGKNVLSIKRNPKVEKLKNEEEDQSDNLLHRLPFWYFEKQ